jgi:hypothetical protein
LKLTEQSYVVSHMWYWVTQTRNLSWSRQVSSIVLYLIRSTNLHGVITQADYFIPYVQWQNYGIVPLSDQLVPTCLLSYVSTLEYDPIVLCRSVFKGKGRSAVCFCRHWGEVIALLFLNFGAI